ncbi:MAG TPA: universal stress protein [Anaerolineaceae bacterium]|nr:universal stress protein [Anaerolineaceae bacterium]
MNANGLRLLICTNGSEPSRLGIDYGLRLAESLGLAIHLLCIDEKSERTPELKQVIDDTVQRMETAHIPHEIEVLAGSCETILPQRAAESAYISIVGRLARPFWRNWITGRSFRSLLADIASPLIYVPRIHWPLKRMLICTGGLKYVFSLEHVAFHLARQLGAEITLLHVVQPVQMDYPLAQNVQEHWKTLLQTNTPPGTNPAYCAPGGADRRVESRGHRPARERSQRDLARGA